MPFQRQGAYRKDLAQSAEWAFFLLKDLSTRKRAAPPSLTTWRPHHHFGIQKLIPPRIDASFSSRRRRVASENVVVIFCRRVAGEALFVQRLIARLALGEVGKSPAAGCGVFF